MKIKRIVKWSALAFLLALFAWFEFAYWTSTNDCGRKIPPGAERMKAIRYCEYGPPDSVLKLEQVERPVPNENQILVKVILLTIYLVKIQTQVNPIITEFDSVQNPLLRITS